jgi:hypothetical protein
VEFAVLMLEMQFAFPQELQRWRSFWARTLTVPQRFRSGAAIRASNMLAFPQRADTEANRLALNADQSAINNNSLTSDEISILRR